MSNEEAEEHKKKGNQAFKEKSWEEAIKHYNKAITLDPENAAYYSNRAAAWSSKGNHDSALSDANRCIDKDPTFAKGYTRKGSALYTLGRFEEADDAYKGGLEADPNNDGCKQGLEMIKKAKEAQKARSRSGGSSSSSSNPFGNLGGLGGMVEKVTQRLKSGGRMQMYMVMMAFYMMFSAWKSGNTPKTSGSDSPTQVDGGMYDEDEVDPHQFEGPSTRTFADIGSGAWLSYVHAGRKPDPVMMLLHRTGSSADAEFDSVLSRTETNPSPLSGIRLLAPDRPCHGYSPCPLRSEPKDASGWLQGVLSASHGNKVAKMQFVAVGREAAVQALGFISMKKRPNVTKLWLLDPGLAAPVAPAAASSPASSFVKAWLEGAASEHLQAKATAGAAADAIRWFDNTAASEPKEPRTWNVAKMPKHTKVSILYSENAEENTELQQALEEHGLQVQTHKSKKEQSSLDLLVADVRAEIRAREDQEAGEDGGHQEAQGEL